MAQNSSYFPVKFTNVYRKQVYIENGYMLSEHEYNEPQKQEDYLFSEYEKIKQNQHLANDTYYHFGTPCTVENQKKLLLSSGFLSVKEVWKKEQ